MCYECKGYVRFLLTKTAALRHPKKLNLPSRLNQKKGSNLRKIPYMIYRKHLYLQIHSEVYSISRSQRLSEFSRDEI